MTLIPKTRKKRPVAARLWEKVPSRPTEGCWLWIGCPKPNGYGVLRVGGKNVYAHRLSYELLVGPIPDGLTIDHLCGVRNCVNPAHLEPVTRGENCLRGGSPLAQNARKTHCKHGHEFTVENTSLVKNGRQCRTCLKEKDDRRYGNPDYLAKRRAYRQRPRVRERERELERKRYARKHGVGA